MDLHSIASGAIGTVNPFIPATIRVSTGYTTSADGTQVPAYKVVQVSAQVQALTFKDLQQVDGMNLNGTRRAIYLHGEFDGTVRVDKKGGDIITVSRGVNAGVWLVAQVLEQFPDWCKVAVTLQDGS